jgi:hypothetical protein
MKIIYTIYGLVNVESNSLFYIGQTCTNMYYRLYSHVLNSKNGMPYPIYNEIRTMATAGINPIIIALENKEFIDNESGIGWALQKEKEFIINYSVLGTLKNISHNPFYDKKNKNFTCPTIKSQINKIFTLKDSLAFLPPPNFSSDERIQWHNNRSARGIDKFTYDPTPDAKAPTLDELFVKTIDLLKLFSESL